MRLIHKFVNRGVRCILLCLGRHLQVCWFPPSAEPLTPKPDRRKGLSSSNRATAAIFLATVINFLLSSLNTGAQVAAFTVSIRMALILDIDHPLLEKPELINRALQNTGIMASWARVFPVSTYQAITVRSRTYFCSVEGLLSNCSAILFSFGGLGPSFRIGGG